MTVTSFHPKYLLYPIYPCLRPPLYNTHKRHPKDTPLPCPRTGERKVHMNHPPVAEASQRQTSRISPRRPIETLSSSFFCLRLPEALQGPTFLPCDHEVITNPAFGHPRPSYQGLNTLGRKRLHSKPNQKKDGFFFFDAFEALARKPESRGSTKVSLPMAFIFHG